MSLVQLYGTGPASGFACQTYERATPAGKRCKHYLDGGACALPTEFMCVEWLRANGQRQPPAQARPPRAHSAPRVPVRGPGTTSRAAQARPATVAPVAPVGDGPAMPPRAGVSADASQSAMPWAPAMPAEAPTSAAPAAPEHEPAAPESRAPITADEIESFKALGVEVCLDLEGLGPIWLVPAYRDPGRKEITPEHAATLRLLLEAFPGARVAAFERRAATEESA